jgi:hypothetical protein
MKLHVSVNHSIIVIFRLLDSYWAKEVNEQTIYDEIAIAIKNMRGMEVGIIYKCKGQTLKHFC